MSIIGVFGFLSSVFKIISEVFSFRLSVEWLSVISYQLSGYQLSVGASLSTLRIYTAMCPVYCLNQDLQDSRIYRMRAAS